MKPTLEEVKEYFENAEKCISSQGSEFNISDYDLNGIYKNMGAACVKRKDGTVRTKHLYDFDEKRWGQILTTKEKTFSITSGQLMQLENGFTLPKLKEWFPEVFEVKLEVGKWYKSDMGGLWYVEKITKNGQISFGINYEGRWIDSGERQSTGLFEAIEQEVFEALKNEAEKRGFGEKCLFYFEGFKFNALYGNNFTFEDGKLYLQEGIVFSNGKWAEIIPTCTRAEAEKLLNKKIID